MPTIALVSGIAIQIYYEDHDPPHFHARASDFRVKIAIADFSVISVTGRMRQAQYRMIVKWAYENRAALLDNWQRAQRGDPLVKIGA